MLKKGSVISNYWDLIDYNVHHIRHSELKASLILTAYGIIFGLAYDVSGAEIDNVIYPSIDPMIFELKNPNQDIKGRVVPL